MNDVWKRLRDLNTAGDLSLPYFGCAQTPQRLLGLANFGQEDLSLARLVEAHVDARTILYEAGRVADRDVLYGVWASEHPKHTLQLTRVGERLRLNGSKPFCSGSRRLDAALVTAGLEDEKVLVDVKLRTDGIEANAEDWKTQAFSSTETATVTFRDVEIGEGDLVGRENWYVTRIGFWLGAMGPAACWAGGALGLIEAAKSISPTETHARAQLGALLAKEWELPALLNQAGLETDRGADDYHDARRRALKLRYLIERSCTDVIDRFGRATGPRLLAFDEAVAQRHAELSLYIRQSHAERDLESIVD